jgi:hypothetical protein
VTNETLAQFSSVEELFLDGNDLMSVEKTRFGQLVGGMLNLSLLSLSHCELRDLRFIRAVPESVSELRLAGNRLTTVPDGALDFLSKLQRLDLSVNSIAMVTEQTFSPDTRNRLKSLALNTNQFVCSCHVVWFRAWLLARPDLFSPRRGQTAEYNCTNIPHTSVQEYRIHPQQCLLSEQTSVMIIASCTLVVTSLTAALLLVSYRWHVRLLLYEAFRDPNNDRRRRRLLTQQFTYDVFVSYDSRDLHWVRHRLMAELEGEMGLRLCVHERDFIPGKNIVDNIAQCVERSKKVMMVFSRHFVRSQWCQFELTYCLRHVMDYDDVLIIVCVDDVVSTEMTSAMMAVLKTTTYIQWAEHRDAARSFWGRIRLALQDIFDVNDQLV